MKVLETLTYELSIESQKCTYRLCVGIILYIVRVLT